MQQCIEEIWGGGPEEKGSALKRERLEVEGLGGGCDSLTTSRYQAIASDARESGGPIFPIGSFCLAALWRILASSEW